MYVFLFLIWHVTAQYVKVFTCSNIMLSITMLLLIGSVPLKAMILVFWCEISIPNVRFQVLTAASMMFRAVFWVILPCRMIVDHSTRQYNPEDSSEHQIPYRMFVLCGVKHIILSVSYLLSLRWHLGHLQIIWYLILCHLMFLFL
jgi:hypothetical protein